MSSQASLGLVGQSQLESEEFWDLLMARENPWGKPTTHWLWRVKNILPATQSQAQAAAARRMGTRCVL